MEMLRLTTRITKDATLNVTVPDYLSNHQVDVLLVLQPIDETRLNPTLYPPDFFERLDAIQADDMIERSGNP